MKIDEILKLVNAGYSKEEIDKLDVTDQKSDQKTDQKSDQKKDQKSDQKTDQKSESFDYEKFAAALVKAQQLANGKQNFGGSHSDTDISRFF
nr:MAG TPA_asm: hypothetical protein [Caudoviricetes sp.]